MEQHLYVISNVRQLVTQARDRIAQAVEDLQRRDAAVPAQAMTTLNELEAALTHLDQLSPQAAQPSSLESSPDAAEAWSIDARMAEAAGKLGDAIAQAGRTRDPSAP